MRTWTLGSSLVVVAAMSEFADYLDLAKAMVASVAPSAPGPQPSTEALAEAVYRALVQAHRAGEQSAAVACARIAATESKRSKPSRGLHPPDIIDLVGKAIAFEILQVFRVCGVFAEASDHGSQERGGGNAM